jgi:pyruvate kinase
MEKLLYLRAGFGAAVVVVLATLGCADPHVSAVEQMVAALREMNATLESIHDQASAEAAHEKLRALSARIAQLNQRIQSFAEVSPSAQGELEPLLSQLRQQTLLLVQNMQRVAQQPELRALLPEVATPSTATQGTR